MSHKLLLLFLLCSIFNIHAETQYSKLWGKEGELWSPQSQLPDFSFAGCYSGGKTIPNYGISSNVKDFGASPNSQEDSTEAFKQAIAASTSGAIYIPAGRYLLSDILLVEKPSIVLRGAGPNKTILEFTTELEDIKPNMGKTKSGRSTSNYSWSGGFICLRGSYREKFISLITEKEKRGTKQITVADSTKLKVGQYITIELTEDKNKSLIKELYSSDSGDTSKLKKTIKTKLTTKIVAINDKLVNIERPLPFDIKLKWKPFIKLRLIHLCLVK